MLNIEIKARYDNLDTSRRISHELGAAFEGTDTQTDTYFDAPNGLLKLREATLSQDHLIFYSREKLHSK